MVRSTPPPPIRPTATTATARRDRRPDESRIRDCPALRRQRQGALEWSTINHRQSATNGQIVGHCDTRASRSGGTTAGSHLEHLHNSSHKCNDGSDAHTSALQFFDPTCSLLASALLAVEPVGAPAPPAAPTPAAPPRPAANMPAPAAAAGGSNPAQQPGNGISSVSSTFAAYPPHFQTEALQTITAPTAENPTGRSTDEYKANTWEGLINQRPTYRPPEDRHQHAGAAAGAHPHPQHQHAHARPWTTRTRSRCGTGATSTATRSDRSIAIFCSSCGSSGTVAKVTAGPAVPVRFHGSRPGRGRSPSPVMCCCTAARLGREAERVRRQLEPG